jgi:hypothetical protein
MAATPNTFLYNNARHLFASAQLDWATATAHAVLVNAAYAPQPGDKFFSAIPVGAVMQDVLMTSLTEINGLCSGTIPQFNAFTSASQVVALVIYIHTGDPTTSPLVYYSADGFGFPFKPLGFNYFVGFDQSAGGFFQV